MHHEVVVSQVWSEYAIELLLIFFKVLKCCIEKYYVDNDGREGLEIETHLVLYRPCRLLIRGIGTDWLRFDEHEC